MLRVSDQTPDGAMEPQPETAFPATLSRWVQEIVLSIPGPARSTLAELIVGAMLAGCVPTRGVAAVGKWPAGATVKSRAQAAHLSTGGVARGGVATADLRLWFEMQPL